MFCAICMTFKKNCDLQLLVSLVHAVLYQMLAKPACKKIGCPEQLHMLTPTLIVPQLAVLEGNLRGLHCTMHVVMEFS